MNKNLETVEKLRIVAKWTGWHNEGFNFKVRNFADFEILYDIAQATGIECMDDEGIEGAFDTDKETEAFKRTVNTRLGYKLYNV